MVCELIQRKGAKTPRRKEVCNGKKLMIKNKSIILDDCTQTPHEPLCALVSLRLCVELAYKPLPHLPDAPSSHNQYSHRFRFMKPLSSTILTFFASTLLLSSCCCPTKVDNYNISGLIASRIDQQVQWNLCSDDEIDLSLQCLLQSPLTADTAVQIALLHNPSIQATYEEIGISHADLVQAGILQNPVFVGMVRFPDQKHATINTDFSITQNFLDFLMIPLRQKIAASALEETRYKVAHAILDVSFDVQEVFYNLQVEQLKLELMQPLVDATEAARLLAAGQYQAGNVNDLTYQQLQNEALNAKTELSRIQVEIIRLREKLNQLLGLCSKEIYWSTAHDLPPLPANEPSMERLENVALNHRLDLEAARWDVERISRMFGITEWWAYTNDILGVSTGKDAEGITTTGPAFSVDLPIFNYGQAERMRLQALFRQSLDRLYALEIKALAEVRSARDRLMIHRDLTLTYQKEILPLQQQLVTMSQQYYGDMALSVYSLLNSKQEELQMSIQAQISLRDYWIARVELDRALGGNLTKALNYFDEDLECDP